jgi:hypothetical protein
MTQTGICSERAKRSLAPSPCTKCKKDARGESQGQHPSRAGGEEGGLKSSSSAGPIGGDSDLHYI